MAVPKRAAPTLRYLVDVRRKTTNPDGHGGFVTSWATVAQLPVSAESLNGREAVLAGALQGVSSFRFVTRFLPAEAEKRPQTGDQIVHEGRSLNIRTVEDRYGDRKWLDILADTLSVETD